MPRNRSARLAVLGSSFQRAASPQYPSRNGSALRRRLVAAVLVVVSLVLVTVYFRESDRGPLHDLQSTGATVLRPFEVAANRVARPFRDLAGWVDGLTDAKTQNEKLRRELDQLRQQLIQSQTAITENQQLKALLDYQRGPAFPDDFRGRTVAAAVISRAPTQFEQQIVIAAGTRDGVGLRDPVVTNEGLVGQVTKVARGSAEVTLLTDETSAVSVVDLRTSASGILRHGPASGGSLVLDRVTKDQVVNQSDPVVTAGWRSRGLSSLYPRGIPVGTVTSVGQVDTDLYKQVQVQPFVDFSSLSAVLVLTGQRQP